MLLKKSKKQQQINKENQIKNPKQAKTAPIGFALSA